MRTDSRLARTMSMGFVGMVVLGWSLSGHGMEEITPVAKIWANPSAFHRHSVVLKGVLKLVSRWEGKDAVGAPTCGPIFKLDDDSGDIPVMYIIRCDADEVGRVTAMAGERAIVHAMIEAATVVSTADGSEYQTRAIATKIQREEK
jgi:hypothetical protein